MPRKDEYPQSRHIAARVEAIVEAFADCRGMLAVIERLGTESGLPDELRRQVSSTLQRCKRAVDAVNGA
jgi:hypothetical protein